VIGDLLIGVLGVINAEEFVDFVKNWLELLNAFKSLLDGLELITIV
jgi:hypothetical protein